MKEAVSAVLARLKEQLSALYGKRLKGVYLFGSHARGEADEESDIDVLVVLDRVGDYAAEVARSSEIISQLSLDCGHTIGCVYASEEQWQKENTMFFLNVREEAVLA